ncbi:pyridoxamine 5'-phosphate oxidase family protein, partial [Mesorhizobium sp. M7A.F.Ca.US.001.04.1.1]
VVGAAEPCPRLMPDMERPRNLAGYAEGARLDEALTQAQRVYEGEV